MEKIFEPEKIDALIQLAIDEDIGTGDITTANLLPDDLIATGAFLAKGNGVVAGLPIVEYFFSKLDKSVLVQRVVDEGAFVREGEIIATISGRARTLLTGERDCIKLSPKAVRYSYDYGAICRKDKTAEDFHYGHEENHPWLALSGKIRCPCRRRCESPDGTLRPGTREG